jgi:hypothetical protein
MVRPAVKCSRHGDEAKAMKEECEMQILKSFVV